MNRLLGRSVVDLAQAVDEALGELAQAQGQEAACQEALRLAQQDVAAAQAKVRAARDALFEEHPRLAGTDVPKQQEEIDVHHPRADQIGPATDPSKFEVVEVDDDNDPRYTAGFSPVSPRDDVDLPPVEWEEHDG